MTIMDFDEWWQRAASRFVGTNEEVARLAFNAARAMSGNYVADDVAEARKVTFANGRIVQIGEDGFLVVSREE